MQKREFLASTTTEHDAHYSAISPLKPAELQVLRAQYEKEGDYVGVQTKFNYAWVCRLFLFTDFEHGRAHSFRRA